MADGVVVDVPQQEEPVDVLAVATDPSVLARGAGAEVLVELAVVGERPGIDVDVVVTLRHDPLAVVAGRSGVVHRAAIDPEIPPAQVVAARQIIVGAFAVGGCLAVPAVGVGGLAGAGPGIIGRHGVAEVVTLVVVVLDDGPLAADLVALVARLKTQLSRTMTPGS